MEQTKLEEPKLDMEFKAIVKVEYSNLEKFIKEVYGQNVDYNFCSDVEACNDSTYSFDVEKEELDESDMETIKEFKEGKYVPFITQTIMTDLCNNGKIPEAEYIINVCW